MWQQACAGLDRSVHAVITQVPATSAVPMHWRTLGTAFAIDHEHNPTFLTNAHVVINAQGQPRTDLALAILGNSGAIAGASVRILELGLDLAVVEASTEAAQAVPVTFASRTPPKVGTSVASLGFPIPEAAIHTPTGGQLSIRRKFAQGALSNPLIPCVIPTYPWAPADLYHYELNMLYYPGISGGPLFDIQGRVLGVNRGSANIGSQIASYAFALRNAEVLDLLDTHHIKYVSK